MFLIICDISSCLLTLSYHLRCMCLYIVFVCLLSRWCKGVFLFKHIYIYSLGVVRVQLLGTRRPALVLFLFYVNVSGMRLWSRFSSQPLRIQGPWFLLHVGWSIPLITPWVTTSRFLAGNREFDLKPPLSLSLSLLSLFYLNLLHTLSFTLEWKKAPNTWDFIYEVLIKRHWQNRRDSNLETKKKISRGSF